MDMRTLTSILHTNITNVSVRSAVRDAGRLIHHDSFAASLERYLGETLHDRVHLKAFEGEKNLPAFLKHGYRLFEARIVGRRCVVLAARHNVATPSDIAKHVQLVRSAVDAIVVFAAPSVTAYYRSRLSAKGSALSFLAISFISQNLPRICANTSALSIRGTPKGSRRRPKPSCSTTCSTLTRTQRHRQSPNVCATRRCLLAVRSMISWP